MTKDSNHFALFRSNRRMICKTYASRKRYLPIPFMPVYLVDQDLSKESDWHGGKQQTHVPSSVPSVGITLTAAEEDSSSAKDIHVVVTKGADGVGEAFVDAATASGSTPGGYAGMTALLRLLTKRLTCAAEHGAKEISEASITRGGPLPGLPGSSPEGQSHEGCAVSAGSFDSELRALLEGGSLDEGKLAPALAQFSTAFIFHLQRELHSARLKLDT